MDVLFIDFPSFLGDTNWHLGFRFMISALRNQGFKAGLYYPPQFTLRRGFSAQKVEWIITSVKQALGSDCRPALLDNPLFAPLIKKMILEIKHRQPALLGFSPWDGSLLMLTDFIRRLKKAGVKAKTVLGGHYATFVHDQILKNHPEIDFVVRGEGEETICELAESVINRRSFSPILGLSFREKGKVQINPARPLIEDLDRLPIPATDHYQHLTRTAEGSLLWLLAEDAGPGQGSNLCYEYVPFSTSRGCYGTCSYCSIQRFYRSAPHKKAWRALSPPKVVEQIALLKQKYGIFRFNFVDDDYLAGREGRERALAIAREINRKRLKIEFAISTRANDLNKETLTELKKAGLIYVFLGIDSAFQRGLDTFDKHMKEETNYSAMELLGNAGLKVNAALIFFDPYLKPEEIPANLKFIQYFMRMKNPARLQAYFDLRVYPGISLVPRLQKDGLLTGSYLKYGYKFADRRSAKIHSLVEKIPEELSFFLSELILGAKFNLLKEDRSIRHSGLPLIVSQIKYISRYYKWLEKTFKFQLLEDAAELFQGLSPAPAIYKFLLERAEGERIWINNLYSSMLATFLGEIDHRQLRRFKVKGQSFIFCGPTLFLFKAGGRKSDIPKYLKRLNDLGYFISQGEEIDQHRQLAEQGPLVTLEMIAAQTDHSLFEKNLNFFLQGQVSGTLSQVRLLLNDRNEKDRLRPFIGKLVDLCNGKNISVELEMISKSCTTSPARSLADLRPVQPMGSQPMANRSPAGEKALHYCPAGVTSFFVDKGGDIYPCLSFKRSRSMLLGNVASGGFKVGLRRHFIEAIVDKKRPCFNCWAKFACGGGCSFAAFRKNGSIYNPDTGLCPSIKQATVQKLKEAAIQSLAATHADPT